MKKQLLILIALLCSTALWAQTYSGGSGTTADPYQIANKADLKYLSENSGDWTDKHFVQTADIVFADADFESDGDFYNSGEGFSPIGNEATNFTGSYDGGGFEIDGLYINRTSDEYSALFGYVSGGNESDPIVIKNLGIGENSHIENRYNSDDTYAAGIVAYSNGVLIIEGCYNRGTVTSSSEDSYSSGGGLVAYANSSLTINNSYNSGIITSSSSVFLFSGGGLWLMLFLL